MHQEFHGQEGIILLTDELVALQKEVEEARLLGNKRNESHFNASEAKWIAYLKRRNLLEQEFEILDTDCPEFQDLVAGMPELKTKPSHRPSLEDTSLKNQEGVVENLLNQIEDARKSLEYRIREDPTAIIPFKDMVTKYTITGNEPFFFYERTFVTSEAETVVVLLEIAGANNGQVYIHSKKPLPNYTSRFMSRELFDKITISPAKKIEISTNHSINGSLLIGGSTKYQLPLIGTPDAYRFKNICNATENATRIVKEYLNLPLSNCTNP